MTATAPHVYVTSCAWCRVRIEWVRPFDGATPPLYCNGRCKSLAQVAAKEARANGTPGVCPHPWKARHGTAEEAMAVIVADPVGRNGNKPYLCPGGEHYHLGRLPKPTPVVPFVRLAPMPKPRLPEGARPGPPPARRG